MAPALMLAVLVGVLAGCHTTMRTPVEPILAGDYAAPRTKLYQNMSEDRSSRQYLLDRMRVAVLTLADGYPEAAQVVLKNLYENLMIVGDDVLDAGTEINTEDNAAFLNQSSPDTGTSTDEVIDDHIGFNSSEGNPHGEAVNILGETNPNGISFGETAADFTRDGAQIARVQVVPEPASLMLLGVGGLTLLRRKRRATIHG